MKLTISTPNSKRKIEPYSFFPAMPPTELTKIHPSTLGAPKKFSTPDSSFWWLWQALWNPQEIRFNRDLHICQMKFYGVTILKIWWVIAKSVELMSLIVPIWMPWLLIIPQECRDKILSKNLLNLRRAIIMWAEFKLIIPCRVKRLRRRQLAALMSNNLVSYQITIFVQFSIQNAFFLLCKNKGF